MQRYGLAFIWFYLGYAGPKWKTVLFPGSGLPNLAFNLVINALVFILPVLIAAGYQPHLAVSPLVSRITGIGLVALSLCLQILARKEIGLWPGGPYRGLRPEQTLVTTGIYRRLRHPIYLAFILWQAGLALAFRGTHALIFSGIYVLALFPLIILEERELGRRYGDEYREYKKQTPILFALNIFLPNSSYKILFFFHEAFKDVYHLI
jgi:protein-S-isoprenylcysteine O-methyltransferase Ste14